MSPLLRSRASPKLRLPAANNPGSLDCLLLEGGVATVIPELIVSTEEAQNQLNEQLQADLEMSDTSDEEGYADAYIIDTDAEDEFEEDVPLTDVEPDDTPEEIAARKQRQAEQPQLPELPDCRAVRRSCHHLQ